MKTKKIETIEQFEQFCDNSKTFSKEIFLNLDSFDEDKNEYFSKKINGYKNACGCETGTASMLISILTGVIWLLLNFSDFKENFISDTIYFILFVFLFSIIGKVVGLTIAKFKLYRILNNIKKEITQLRLYNKGFKLINYKGRNSEFASKNPGK